MVSLIWWVSIETFQKCLTSRNWENSLVIISKISCEFWNLEIDKCVFYGPNFTDPGGSVRDNFVPLLADFGLLKRKLNTKHLLFSMQKFLYMHKGKRMRNVDSHPSQFRKFCQKNCKEFWKIHENYNKISYFELCTLQ